jgi:hypothetical protein
LYSDHAHVRLRVADGAQSALEDVPARQIEGPRWRLLRSPLYARGAAAGDVVRVLSERGDFEVLERGGNVRVHFYLPSSESDSPTATNRVEESLAAALDAAASD